MASISEPNLFIIANALKFKDKVYQIKATEGPRILVPMKMLSELKTLPEHTLSAQEAVNEVCTLVITRSSQKC